MSRPAAAAREDGEVEALRRRVVALEAEVACLRRGAEQSGPALRAAEILESIDDAFYALDRELRFTYVNRHALAFWGRTAAQLLGEPVFAAFPQGKGSDVHRGLASALETGAPVRLETFSPVIHRWLAFNIYPSETGLAVYFRDIDDQKRGEAALREGEARLRGLFEGANDAILLVDRASGRYVDWNRRVLELTGYSADELAAKRLGDLTVPEQLGPVRDRLARLAEGESAIIEYDLAGKGGRRVPVELSARLLRVGGTVLLQAIMRDLTERRAAERAVRESAERLRLAVEATGLGTWDVDPATGLRSWSDEFKAICGLPPEAPADYAAFDALIDPDDRAWVEERYAAAFRPEGGSYDAEFRIRRADDGTVRWVRTTGRVHFEGGRRSARSGPWRTSPPAAPSRRRCARARSGCGRRRSTRASASARSTRGGASCGSTRPCAPSPAARARSCFAAASSTSPTRTRSRRSGTSTAARSRARSAPTRSRSSTGVRTSGSAGCRSRARPCATSADASSTASASSRTSPTASWPRRGSGCSSPS